MVDPGNKQRFGGYRAWWRTPLEQIILLFKLQAEHLNAGKCDDVENASAPLEG